MYTPKDVIRSYQLIYDNKLYEKFHIFNGLQDDVDIVYDIIKSFIIDNLENKKFRTSIITCNDSINNINLSFCNLSIIINAKKFIVENDANSYITAVNGEYYNDEGDFKNKKFNIKIKFSISYVNLNEEFEEEIKKVIAHELTHAYNDYKAKLNGKTLHYIINTNLLINLNVE